MSGVNLLTRSSAAEGAAASAARGADQRRRRAPPRPRRSPRPAAAAAGPQRRPRPRSGRTRRSDRRGARRCGSRTTRRATRARSRCRRRRAGSPSPKDESRPSAASIPSAPQPITSSAVGDRADSALDRGQEDRDREPAGEQVADVVVDERARRSSATTRRRPGRRSRRGRGRIGEPGRTLDDQERPPETTSAAIVTAGRVGQVDRAAGERARGARPPCGGGARRRSSRTRTSSPTRSSFGARLRSRVPQYGHSVT